MSGTQIQDSYVIDRDADAERSDVAAIAALFKLWGVPFDVLRLDVHSMTLEDFVDEAGNARYGAIVWAARQDQYPWQLQDYGLLTQAVATKGVSLLAVGDRIREPAIQQLLGITYLDTGNTCDTVVLSGPSQSHFVIRGLEGTRTALGPFQFARVRVSVDPGARVTTLADACGLPQLTVRTVDAASRTRAVWLGGGLNVFDENPTFIKLLQRALVWAVGYGVYKEYGNAVLLRMDDPGCATSAYFKCGSPPWYFAPLSAADWNTRVLQPLRSYNARLGVAFCAGYPDPDHTHPVNTILPSCSIDVASLALDCGAGPEVISQNVRSTCAGLHDGVNAGLIEIHGHGYTHMLPDLTGWWAGSARDHWNMLAWYREFYDGVRRVEIEKAVQHDRMVRSSAVIAAEFGNPPLMFVPPGHLISGWNTRDRRNPWDDSPRFDGPGTSLPVTVRGAVAKARYNIYFGNSTWRRLGTVRTDANGNASAILTVPASLLGSAAGQYFLFKRGATQFVAGPTATPLDLRIAIPLRSGLQMTVGEQSRFRIAADRLAAGNVGSGSLPVALNGAVANATYTVQFGNTAWTQLGTVTTDLAGSGHALLAIPSSLLGSPAGQYFTLERGSTQFIAGPTTAPFGLTAALPVRNRRRMTPQEQSRFFRAADSLVAGSVNASTFLPNHIAATYTYKIAGESSFGFAHGDTGQYLGRDYVITLPQVGLVSAQVGLAELRFAQQQLDVMQQHFDRGVPGVVYHHDADVVHDPSYYPRMLGRIQARWPDAYYLTPDEWSAYLHAVLSAAAPTTDSIHFDFGYDTLYARYFGSHASAWTLHLCDELRADLRSQGKVDVVIDGVAQAVKNANAYFEEKHALVVPAGTGTHTILFRRHTGL